MGSLWRLYHDVIMAYAYIISVTKYKTGNLEIYYTIYCQKSNRQHKQYASLKHISERLDPTSQHHVSGFRTSPFQFCIARPIKFPWRRACRDWKFINTCRFTPTITTQLILLCRCLLKLPVTYVSWNQNETPPVSLKLETDMASFEINIAATIPYFLPGTHACGPEM